MIGLYVSAEATLFRNSRLLGMGKNAIFRAGRSNDTMMQLLYSFQKSVEYGSKWTILDDISQT